MTQVLHSGDIDRYRMYALLEALENDLRACIEEFVLHAREADLGSYEEKVRLSMERDRDGAASGASPVHYLDLGDEIDLLNEKSANLPSDIRLALKSSTEALKAAVPARHRIMHFKPLMTDDLERLLDALNAALTRGVPLPSTKLLVTTIQRDPKWVPQLPDVKRSSRILNNLPLPEHDETGLIGRQGEVRALTKWLRDGRFPVITILGPGGMGKTALALQVLHDLADDPESELDAILWVSLKTEALTSTGLQTLRQPIADLSEVVSEIAAPLDDDFEGTMDQLGRTLEGLRTLVCVDNLETTSGGDALRLIDSLPPETRFLFTSRVGIGQVERLHNLGPLEPASAAALMRKMARSRDIPALADLGRERAEGLVADLHLSPLGIKWFVLSVESGRRPETILEHQGDLLRFCVENVWSALDENAATVAKTLGVLEHPATTQELALYLDRGADELRRSLHALQRHALARPVAFGGGELAEAFALTDTASRYLAGLPSDGSATEEIHRRQQIYLASEERRRLDEARAPLAPHTVLLVDEVDQPAALILREALTKSHRGDSSLALDLVNQAAGLSPAFYEVDRVRGFILSSAGSTDSATASYDLALTKSPTEWHRARVAYLFAGHLARQAMDAQAAKQKAEMADAVFNNVETKIQLALIDVYLGELDRAIASLTILLEKAEGKQQRIVATSLMDALRRKSESTWVDLQFGPDALSYCLDGARLGSSFFATGVGDNRMIEVCVECVRDGVGMVARSPHIKVLHSAAIELLEIFIRHQTLFQYAPGYSGVVKSAQRLANAEGDGISAKLRALSESLCAEVTAGEDHLDLALGTVKTWRADRGFGFISSGVGEVFFHKSSVTPPNFLAFVRRGTPVAFKASEGDPGLKADMVTLFPGADPDPSDLRRRRLTVADRPAGREFLFAKEIRTGVAVFVHRTVVNSVGAWNRLEVGTEFSADIQLVGDDRLRVARGSVEIQ